MEGEQCRNVAIIGVAILLSSCTPPTQPNQGLEEASTKIATLSKKLETMSQQLTSLRKDVGSLQFQQGIENERYKSAEFDPAEPGFQRVDANYGSFAVSLEDVKQFADGVRIKLNIGNLSSATFSGVKLSLRYGPRAPDLNAENWPEKYNAWQVDLKTKEQTLNENIRPANWNPIQIALPNIEEKKFGYLEVKIETKTINLYR